MPVVRPFRTWRYPSDRDLHTVTAPPYDVISPSQREELLSLSAHNVVALELPEGSLDPQAPNNRYEIGAKRWTQWTSDGTLVRDDAPTIYVLEQRFTIEGRPIRRRAFIAEVMLHPFADGVVLPHERTLPKALGDRYALLEATATNLSQVFGLYSDPERITDASFEAGMAEDPIMTVTDPDGVVSSVWAMTDPEQIAAVTSALAHSNVFIADGHHRYTVALAYRDARRSAAVAAGKAHVDPDYDYVMMALVNLDDPNLIVLPTHRVADSPGYFSAEGFYEGLRRNFDITELPSGSGPAVPEDVARPSFLVKTAEDQHPKLAILRADVDPSSAVPGSHSSAYKELDVTLLQELVLDPLLDIHPDRPETLARLSFFKDAGEALAATSEHDVAFILGSTKMEQMKAVSLAGEVMPQKSTYFYPKLLSGLVLRSIDD